MNKKLDLQHDVIVTSYNDVTVESQHDVKQTSSLQTNNVFSNMPDAVEINITHSGEYKINAGNKNIIVNILNGLEVQITEVNNTTDPDLVSAVELVVSKDAKVKYLVVDMKQKAFNYRHATVLENAHLDLHLIGFNKDYNENKVIVDLDEVNSSANLKLITLANNKTKSIYEGRINNNAPKTKADIWQKAVVKSGGENDFITTGFIKKGADEASNYQESRVLLLDQAALGNSSPLLLIDHYNVVAGHAAGVSRVNEKDLYYLQTRGIDKTTAEHLMTLAFVRPLVDLIEQEDLRGFIENEIERIILH